MIKAEKPTNKIIIGLILEGFCRRAAKYNKLAAITYFTNFDPVKLDITFDISFYLITYLQILKLYMTQKKLQIADNTYSKVLRSRPITT